MTEICNRIILAAHLCTGEKLFSHDNQLNGAMNKAYVKSIPCSI
jgi:hypothetical protein